MPVMIRPRVSIVLILGGLVLASGCADSSRQASIKGPGKELAKQWSKAARQPVDIEDAKPEPEPKLLPMTHFSAGNLFEKQGSYAQAIEQYRKAIEMNTAFAAAYGRLGLCYTKTGQYDLAVPALKRAAELQPASAQLCNNLGFAYLAQKNYAQAESWFGRALLAKPGYTRARLNLAITLVQVKRDAEALGHLLAVVPEPVAQYNLGTMQLAAGRPVEARASFERALSLQADFPAASKGLAESLARLPQLPAAPVVAPVPGPAGPSPTIAPAAELASSAPPVAPPANPAEPAQGQARAGPATRPIVGVDDEPVTALAPADKARVEPVAFHAVVPEVATFQLPGACLAYAGPVVLADEAVPAADPPDGAAAVNVPPEPADCHDAVLDVATFHWPPNGLAWAAPTALSDQGSPAADAGIASTPQPAGQHPGRGDPADESAILRAIVCYVTSREADVPGAGADTPTSVADFDLVSLRWAVWTDGMGCMGVDVATLSSDALQAVLAKWLCALNELDSVTSVMYSATAYADDM